MATSKPRISPEPLDLVYRLAPVGLIGSAAAGVVVWFILRGTSVPAKAVSIWLAVHLLVTLARVGLVYAYRRHRPEPGKARLWTNAFVVGAAIGGAVWGYAASVLLPHDNPPQLVAMAFAVAGMAGGALSSLSPIRYAFPAFVIPFLVPFALRLFMLPDPVHMWTGGGAVIYLALLLAIAQRAHLNLVEGLNLRAEMSDLSERLDVAAKEVVQSKRELKALAAQRKQAESMAHDQQRRWALLTEDSPLAAIEWGRDLTIKGWNTAAARIFGYTREEVLGKQGMELIVPLELRDWTRRFMLNVVNGAGSPHGTFRNSNKSGHPLTCEWYNTPIRAASGEVTEVVSLVMDVTERHEAERMKSRFISTVSHELRTPLTAVSGALSLLANGVAGSANDEARRLITLAERNSKELLKAVDDVITLAKLDRPVESQQPDAVSLLLLLRQAVLQARGPAQRFGVSIKLIEATPMADAMVQIDIELGVKMFLMLIYNAAKATPAGKAVDVVLERNSNEAVRVAIRDYGGGMSAQSRERAFFDYSMLDPLAGRGLGSGPMGLAAAKAFVERLGGSVGLSNDASAGTTVIVVLPVAR